MEQHHSTPKFSYDIKAFLNRITVAGLICRDLSRSRRYEWAVSLTPLTDREMSCLNTLLGFSERFIKVVPITDVIDVILITNKALNVISKVVEHESN